MKKHFLIAATTVPIVFGVSLVLHPGIAKADPALINELNPGAGVYAIDAAHSSIGFEIEHMGLSRVQGRFNSFSGSIDLNDDVTKSSVKFVIKADSIDTAVAPRDNHLKNKDFFDVETYPEISFASTSVKKTERGYIAEGTLKMHGKEGKVSIPFKLGGPMTMQGQSKIGVVAEPFIVKRSEYGMSYGLTPQVMLGDEVTVRVSVEASK